jgi:sugar lactone lactonase YvrE
MCNHLYPRSLTTSLLQRAIGKMLVISALATGFPLFAQVNFIAADYLTPFQPRDVGTTSDVKTVRLQLLYARALTSIAIAPGFDEFTAGPVSGCVVDGHTVNPVYTGIGTHTVTQTACILDVTFSPKYPGVRTAPLVVTDSTGAKSSVGLVGMGLAPQAALTPGIITTIAGNGAGGFGGDGGPATAASLDHPIDAKVDGAGNLYITEFNNSRVRKVDTNGIITTIAGNGGSGFSGIGGPATSASLGNLIGLALDAAGNIYFSSINRGTHVLKVDLNGILTLVAGGGSGDDGGPATKAALSASVTGVAVDTAGNVYFADFFDCRIRKVDTNGIISTVAGNRKAGYSGDGGPATEAQINAVQGVAVDAAGNIYIADWGNDRIRKVDTNGIITTIAGNGVDGFSGDGGPATQAELRRPLGVTVDAAGNVYIGDRDNARVRRVDTNGTIKTIAGNGNGSYNGEGGPATATGLDMWGLTIAPSGGFYVIDQDNNRVHKVDVSQSAVNFAAQTVGTVSPSQKVAVTNTGNQHLELTGLNLSGDFGQQTGAASDCTDTTFLGAGFSCALRITFSPTAAGSLTGSASVTDNSMSLPGTTQTISLSGTGVTQ